MTDLQSRARILDHHTHDQDIIDQEHEYWPFSDEEMDVPLSPFHVDLADYLKAVLSYMYRADGWFISKELAVYGPRRRKNSLTPDVAVFIGVRVQKPYTFSSWYINADNPPPRVVFEVASEKTKDEDFNKLPHYAAWGIEEVYIYDASIPRVWPRRLPERLKGYRVENGTMVEQQPDADGRIWSVALDSWLVPDGTLLLLADAKSNIRLTEGAVAEERALAAQEQALIAQERADAEALARQQAEAQARAMQAQIEAYKVLLRAQGIDPDALS